MASQENSMHSTNGTDNLAFELEPSNKHGSGKVGSELGFSNNKKLDDAKIEELSDTTDRDTYDKPIEFLFSCISMSIGFGSIWRFPFTAYENGGGAFLIAYITFVIMIGIPIYYFEMIIGQFSSSGQIQVWAMAPIVKGVGYSSTWAVICILSYYLSLVGLVIFYFFSSFSNELPWHKCNPEWTEYCFENGTAKNQTTILAKLYYEKDVFPQKANIDDGIGVPEWRLTLCLLASWIFVFVSLAKGIRVSAKTTYFTALSPYAVMIILVIQSATLDGAGEGIKYFLEPDWNVLSKPAVWFEAAGQCLFSLGAGMGAIIVLASYNPFRHNVKRDAIIMCWLDLFTAFIAGLTVFSVLGNLSKNSGLPIQEVATAGPGLAFVSYPAVIATFEWVPQLFAVLFFLMLFAIGIGSASGMTEGVITVICDQFPSLSRAYVTLGTCVIGFLVGLVYVTPGGQFLVTLIGRFGSTNILYIAVIVEVAGACWLYGIKNFTQDVEFMNKGKVSLYFKATWVFFLPVGLLVVFIYSLATEEEFTHENVAFPTSALACGWVITAIGILVIPIVGFHGIHSRKALSFKEKFMESLKPSKKFGPKSPKIHAEWKNWKTSYKINFS